jgi:protoheme ferro-lyase
MRYEVTWMIYEYDFDEEMDIQSFISEQFETLDEAAYAYDEKKKDRDVEYAKICVILNEHSNNYD